MYDEESIALFAAAKAACDPRNLFNPGNLVDPAPLDADLRPVGRGAASRAPSSWSTTAARSATRCTAAPVRQVRRAVDERRDVPVVPRDPRREGRDPRAAPGCSRRRWTARW